MSGILKLLIGAACVSVIAACGVYLLDKFQEHQAAAEYAANAPYRHCDDIYSKIRLFNQTADSKVLDGVDITEEQAACDKLLGIPN